MSRHRQLLLTLFLSTLVMMVMMICFYGLQVHQIPHRSHQLLTRQSTLITQCGLTIDCKAVMVTTRTRLRFDYNSTTVRSSMTYGTTGTLHCCLNK